MAHSINDFRAKTTKAYPCGDRTACRAFLKEVPELADVKMYSVRDTLKEGTKSTSGTKNRVSAR